MYQCEFVWDPARARQVQDLVEKATGAPCPCKEGKPCPFVRVDPTVELQSPEAPAQRAS